MSVYTPERLTPRRFGKFSSRACVQLSLIHISSDSFDEDYSASPDNWLIAPAIELSGDSAVYTCLLYTSAKVPKTSPRGGFI